MMPTYTPELHSVGRSHTLVAIKEQIATRIVHLKTQQKDLQTTGVFVFSEKTLTAINHRIAELNLLLEAIDRWIT